MKRTTVLIFIASIFLGGLLSVLVQTGIAQVFLKTKNQEKKTKTLPEPIKEGAPATPMVEHQTQLVDKVPTNPPSLENQMNQQVPEPTQGIPPGYSSELIDVKFREGTDVDLPEKVLPPDLRDSVANIRRGFSLSGEQLKRIGADRLQLWFRIILRPGANPVAFMEKLKRLSSVESAEFVPQPAQPSQ